MHNRYIDIGRMKMETRNRMLPHRVEIPMDNTEESENLNDWLHSDQLRGSWAVENIVNEGSGICVSTGTRRFFPVFAGQRFFFSDQYDAFAFRLRFR